MTRFGGQLAGALLTLLVMSFAVFCLMGLMPGDPIDLMLASNPQMTPEDAARLRALHGLDQPLPVRWLNWLAGLMTGETGYSRLYGLPVFDVLLPRLANTGLLMGLSVLATLALAVPLAVYSAAMPDSLRSRALNIFCLAGIAAPPFWCALLLIAFFAVTLGWLPASASLEKPLSFILPVATMTLASLAVYLRHLMNAVGEALHMPHIRTAGAKGCSKDRILWRHAFPLAATPLITLLALDLGTLFGGALTIETIFAYPGMGKLLFDGVMGSDYNLALIGFLVLTACVLAANIAADAIYSWLDPRVKAGSKGGGA